jgi:hypothetical protein
MRGIAVEHGVTEFVEHKKDLQEAIRAGKQKFTEDTFLLDEDIEEVDAKIEPWITNCIDVIRLDGLVGTQRELNFEIDGLTFVGYLDFEYEDEIIDLKTTTTVPHILTRGARKGKLPTMKIPNVRQQCLYQYATGKPCKLLYASIGESLYYQIQDDEYKVHMAEIKRVVKEIKNILTKGRDFAILNYSPIKGKMKSFYWNQEMRDKAIELWDLK